MPDPGPDLMSGPRGAGMPSRPGRGGGLFRRAALREKPDLPQGIIPGKALFSDICCGRTGGKPLSRRGSPSLLRGSAGGKVLASGSGKRREGIFFPEKRAFAHRSTVANTGEIVYNKRVPKGPSLKRKVVL